MAHVLVIDDELHVCRIIQMKLKREGYQVTTANNGLAGLRALEETFPDFIILDVDMPIMNGLEMCQEFVQKYPSSNCQIFISTSRTEDNIRSWTAGHSNIHFTEKPISFRNLLRKLAEVSCAVK
jgi:DNA-binding response OmpR family regulator